MRPRIACFGFAFVFVACGSRTELDGASTESIDASREPNEAAPPTLEPCTPMTYGDDLSINTFAVTHDSVFFQDNKGHVIRMPKSGGARTTIFSTWLDAFVADDDYLYWVDANGQLTRLSVDGKNSEALGCAISLGCPPNIATGWATALAVNASVVVVVAVNQQIFTMPKTGGSLVALYGVDAGPTAPPRQVALDDATLAWATDEYIFGVDLSGGAVKTLAGSWSKGVARSSGSTYWAASENGAWHLFQATGLGAGSDLGFVSLRAPLGANAQDVYGGVDDGGIARVPATGGPSTLLVPNVVPVGLVVDGACVYYLTHSATSSYRTLQRTPG